MYLLIALGSVSYSHRLFILFADTDQGISSQPSSSPGLKSASRWCRDIYPQTGVERSMLRRHLAGRINVLLASGKTFHCCLMPQSVNCAGTDTCFEVLLKNLEACVTVVVVTVQRYANSFTQLPVILPWQSHSKFLFYLPPCLSEFQEMRFFTIWRSRM